MNQEFQRLVAEALAGDLSPEDAARLETLCRDDAALAARFVALVDLDRLLPLVARDSQGVDFPSEVIDRLKKENDAVGGSAFVGRVLHRLPPRKPRFAWRRFVLPAAAAAMLMIGVGYFLRSPDATLLRGDSANWIGPAPDSELHSGDRLRLESGLAEILFRDGASLILEGPAELEIAGSNRGWLHSGRVAAQVPEQAHGFIVDSPAGRIIDRGTSFGLSLAADGKAEVQVFEGEVEARPKGNTGSLTLMKNETLRLGGAATERVAGARPDGFVTALPPPADVGASFVHWGFDEGSGETISSDGNLAGESPGAARLRKFGDTFPRWISGVSGTALSFDGWGQALETPFGGLGGGVARTVAFWIRVPADFDPTQGYGVLSWGDLTDVGTAWQISVNPIPEEGDLGRLRVGVYHSPVTGTTDLRDGKWHHCAVVLYGSDTYRETTPVLLYVDGRMETTTNKAVRAVRTHTGPQARPVWLARSIGHGQPGRQPHGTGFFRGALDEVYIFDTALARSGILTLMGDDVRP